MAKQYFDYQNAPEVRGDTVLAFNNKTHGVIHFGSPLSDFQLSFLQWCDGSSWFRNRHALAAEFSALLPEDEEYRKDLFAAISLINTIRPHTIVFKADNYMKETKALSTVRGLKLLLEALDGVDAREVFLLIRLSTNEVMKASAKIDVETGEWDGRLVAKKGWLVPVWSENEVNLFS